jgi:hypothetical protein
MLRTQPAVGSSTRQPHDPHQWRRYLMLKRHRRLEQAGILWSIADLEDGINNAAAPFGFHSPDRIRWNEEFRIALESGFFGQGRRTRVLLLDPAKPVQRITAERARHIIETCGPGEFARYVATSWIRIDDALDWLRTWLDDSFIEQWLSVPKVRDALRRARELTVQKRTNAHGAKQTTVRDDDNRQSAFGFTPVIEDPLKLKVTHWISEFVAHHETHQTMPTREAAFREALQAFREINRHWFDRIYQPPLIPEKWTQRGRRPESRNVKGRDRK